MASLTSAWPRIKLSRVSQCISFSCLNFSTFWVLAILQAYTLLQPYIHCLGLTERRLAVFSFQHSCVCFCESMLCVCGLSTPARRVLWETLCQHIVTKVLPVPCFIFSLIHTPLLSFPHFLTYACTDIPGSSELESKLSIALLISISSSVVYKSKLCEL